jgi:S1-C subfamily serine protease
MSDKPRREAPRTNPQKLFDGPGFDLDRAMKSIVTIQSSVPEDAYTAQILGEQRTGSGVVIRESGLVLTIGYLVTEAESVWIARSDGRVTPGHALAIDPESGFGLVQALDRLDCPALALGSSAEATTGDPVIVAAGGRTRSVHAAIVSKQEFAGYWEYYLDEAIFTAPAHPFWGGAGCIDRSGRLIGIGSLHVEQVVSPGAQRDINMIVPIDLLPPILEDLLTYGRVNKPARPWLGVYSAETGGEVVVAAVSDRAPAAIAGLKRGDIIASVKGDEIADLGDFYRKVWACGPAGVEVPVEIIREGRALGLRVRSADRATFLKKPKLQ